MNFKKILVGGAVALALVSLSACEDGLKDSNKEENVKLSVEFESADYSVPIDGSADLLVKVTPAERASEVEFVVTDESVVTIDAKENVEDGVKLSLSSHKLSSTTIYAVFDDAEKTPECKITVSPIALEGITLDRTEAELKVYESVTLSAKLSPDNVTSPSLTWKSDNDEVASVDNGVVTAKKTGTAVITVSCQGKEASCTVKVSAIPAESIVLSYDKTEISQKAVTVNERLRIDATILPADATYKTVTEWSVSNPELASVEPIVIDGNTVSAYVLGKSIGATELIASISLGEGVEPVTAKIDLVVKPVVTPSDPPRIGDYYYSDGTWSYGGLVSINSDGTDPVWLTGTERPAPEEGKTVIGIVFQTDASRISETEKSLGYTHGLVMSLKRAYKPIELKDPNNKYETPDSLTKFYTGDNLNKSYIDRSTYGTRYYADVNGYKATKGIVDEYKDNLSEFPAVDWTVTDFVGAPAGTSGWYVPSSGQVWDLLANLAGEGVASLLKTEKLYDGDVTYLDFADLTYDPIAELNSHWSLVPQSMKENMHGDTERSGYRYFYFLTSSLYNEESVRVFWVSSRIEGEGKDSAEIKGQFAPYLAWINDAGTCYPVLSF